MVTTTYSVQKITYAFKERLIIKFWFRYVYTFNLKYLKKRNMTVTIKVL